MGNDILSYGGYILGVAGVIGSAAAYFYQSRAKAVIELLQDENEALRQNKQRMDTDLSTAQAQLDAANEKVSYLEQLVLKQPDYGKLAGKLTEQHKEVIKSLSGVAKELTGLTKAIAKGKK